MTKPECAQCGRPVETIAGTSQSDGSYLVHVVCHGHADVFEIPLALRHGLNSPLSDAALVRAFVGGPGAPIEVMT